LLDNQKKLLEKSGYKLEPELAATARADSQTITIAAEESGDGSWQSSSCDACLRRKSHCAMNESINKCYSCEFHRQECTFTMVNGSTNTMPSNPVVAGDLLPRKRKLDETADGE
jgi:hypothetical protein